MDNKPIRGAVQLSCDTNKGVEEGIGQDRISVIVRGQNEWVVNDTCPDIITVTGEDIGPLYLALLIVNTLDIWNIYTPSSKFGSAVLERDDVIMISWNITWSTCLYCSI